MRLGDSPMDYVVVANANPMPPERGAGGGKEAWAWGEDGFDFGDILDAVNPLQHLPVISTIYRELTGDQIAPMPRLMGGALFGGIYGAIASLVNVLVEDGTGKDIGAHAVALLFDREGRAGPGTPPGDETILAEQAETGRSGEAASEPVSFQAPDAPPAPDIGALEDWAGATPPARPAGEPEAAVAGGPAPDAEAPAEPAGPVPGPWVADRMMQALEQYRELLQERRADAAYLDMRT